MKNINYVDKLDCSYYIDENGTMHIFIKNQEITNVADCNNLTIDELEIEMEETLQDKGYFLKTFNSDGICNETGEYDVEKDPYAFDLRNAKILNDYIEEYKNGK